MDEDIINNTIQLIQRKYSVDEKIALEYAVAALESLESHGGSIHAPEMIIKTVDVVIKKWLKDDGLIT